MVRLHTVLIFTLLVILAACNKEAEEGDRSVTIETSGIEEPVSIYIDNNLITNSYDLDEFVKGGDPLLFNVTVKNNSKFEIFELDLKFSIFSITNYNFSINDLGLKQFPGNNGTCTRRLAAGQTCIIELQFTSIISGNINQDIIVSYKNLIKEDSKKFSLTILSGTPASLLFDPNQNNYEFGSPTGAAGKPLLEREFRVTETKILTIANKGELRARNIVTNLTQTCRSYPSNVCPAPPLPGDIAYEWENINCPSVLYAGESCQVRVSLTNWNQGANPLYKEIAFQSVLKFDYGKDPLGNTAALNGNFYVISTNIEARFEASLSSLIFEETLTVGNRDNRVFRAKNSGYRSGILRKFIFYPAGDPNPIYYCQKEASVMLNCYHMDDTPAVLNDLPFYLEDKESCMSQANDILIPDTSGCLFALHFQPSNLKMVGGDEEFDIRFEYDSLFLNQETIITNSYVDFLTQASYRSAARVVVSSMSAAGSNVALDKIDPDGILGHDFGRWGLMLEAYYETIDMSITFTNQGEERATSIAGADGSGNVISMTGSNSLTSFSPSAYSAMTLPSSNCATILPGQSCVLSFKFAPIYRSNEELIHQSLFDYFDAYKSENNFKLFGLEYNNGALYTDANITSVVPDMDRKEVAAKIYGIPVTAGRLALYRNINDGPSSAYIGETPTKTFLIRNIGTGIIPYIRSGNFNSCTGAPNCPPDRDYHNFEYVVSSPADLATYSAKDCLDIINWQDENAYDDRGDLLVEEACLLSIRFNFEHHFYNTHTWEDAAIFGPLDAFWKKDLLGTQFLYSDSDNFEYINAGFQLVYFDGDASNPNKDGLTYDLNLADTYNLGDPKNYSSGNSYDDDDATLQFYLNPHVIPGVVAPTVSALLFREEYTRDQLLNYAGNPLVNLPTKVFPEVWLYGSGAFSTYDITGASPSDTDLAADYTYAWKSIGVARANIGLCADCDYQIHLGAFPENEIVNFGFTLITRRGIGTTITNAAYTGDPEIVFTDIPTEAIGQFIAPLTSVTLTGQFTGAEDTLYSGTFTYTVENKINGGSWTYKILVTAKSVDDPPFLDISQQRYDITTTPGVAPIETIDPTITTLSGSLNNDAINAPYDDTNSILLQMVKLEEIDIDTGYIKKRVNITNTSATKNLDSLEYFFRQTLTNTTPQNMGSVIGFSSTSNCGVTLLPGASCWIDLKYQPNIFGAMANYYLTFTYEVESERYVQQNTLVRLDPLSPSQLTMVGYGIPESVAVGNNVVEGFRIDFGDVVLDQLPKRLTYGPIELRNDSVTLRASLLKTYQELTGQPNFPTPGSGVDIGGIEYFLAYQTDKIEVMANNECFVGEDPVGLQDFEKGFVDDGVTVCNLMVDLILDINTAAKTLDKANPIDMDGFVAMMPYYSFQRINVNYLNFFFTGKIIPDSFSKVGDVFDVEGKDNKTITFKFPQVVANNPSVGDIVGYRIFYAPNAIAFSNVLTAPGAYLPDIYNNSTDIVANFNTSVFPTIDRGKFYYFKIVAIRENPDYNAGNFQNLSDGYYLSDGDIPIVRVMVPKFGHAYIHDLNAMINKDAVDGGGGNPVTYAEALTACSNLSTTIYENGITKNKTYKLMTNAIWERVRYSAENSVYSSGVDPLALPQWVGPSGFDIDVVFSSNPSFNSSEMSQCIAVDKTCYLKCDDGCAFDRMVVGGFYGDASAYDYRSYIGETFPLGHPRCYIDVAP